MQKLFVIGLFGMFAACSGNDPALADPFVEEEIATYFRRFEDEGHRRGLVIDLQAAGIEGYFTDIEEDRVYGQCQQSSNWKRLYVDIPYWEQARELEKEFLIFHELGHCYLGRGHLDEANPDGTCVSIMQSSSDSCQANYTLTTRAAYLDELFSQ